MVLADDHDLADRRHLEQVLQRPEAEHDVLDVLGDGPLDDVAGQLAVVLGVVLIEQLVVGVVGDGEVFADAGGVEEQRHRVDQRRDQLVDLPLLEGVEQSVVAGLVVGLHVAAALPHDLGGDEAVQVVVDGELDEVRRQLLDVAAEDLVEVLVDLGDERLVVLADVAGDAEVHPLEQLGVDVLLEVHELPLQRFFGGGAGVVGLAVAADDGEGELADLDLVAEVDQPRRALNDLAVGDAGAGLG